MSATTRQQRTTTLTVPSTIDSAQAKLVYVYLAQEREVTVDDLAQALDLPKLDLFDVLATLADDDHVERHGTRAVTFSD